MKPTIEEVTQPILDALKAKGVKAKLAKNTIRSNIHGAGTTVEIHTRFEMLYGRKTDKVKGFEFIVGPWTAGRTRRRFPPKKGGHDVESIVGAILEEAARERRLAAAQDRRLAAQLHANKARARIIEEANDERAATWLYGVDDYGRLILKIDLTEEQARAAVLALVKVL